MNQTTKNRIKISRPASTAAVRFTDGMLVTAEDLTAAMHYPLAVVQVLLKSYLGCGIVCGLEVTDPNPNPPRRRENQEGVDYTQDGADAEHEPKRGFMVEIGGGVALGCDAYPIELCGPVKLDLAPDPCGCPIGEGVTKVKYIAIRRDSAPEAPARGCGCGPAADDPGQLCARLGDHVVVEAFDCLPDGICKDAGEREWTGTCACLKTCPSCEPCAEPWVLLATVQINRDGLVPHGINHEEDVRNSGGRAYVKPIACVCRSEADLARRYEGLVQRIGELEKARAASDAQPPSGPRPQALRSAPDQAESRAEPIEATGQAPEVKKAGEAAPSPGRRKKAATKAGSDTRA
jgi:hypothetical protein